MIRVLFSLSIILLTTCDRTEYQLESVRQQPIEKSITQDTIYGILTMVMNRYSDYDPLLIVYQRGFVVNGRYFQRQFTYSNEVLVKFDIEVSQHHFMSFSKDPGQ